MNTTMPGDEAWEHLRTESIGRIVTVAPDGTIDVSPINFATRAGEILIKSTLGTKFNNLAKHPATVFEVDGYDVEAKTAWSIVIHGHARIQAPEWAHAYADTTHLAPMIDVAAEHLVIITPERLSARRFDLR